MDVICFECLMKMIKIKSDIVTSNYPQDDERVMIKRGDLFRCPNCGHECISDFGARYEVFNHDKIVFYE